MELNKKTVFTILLLVITFSEAKKKKKKSKSEADMFDSKTLKCLVCNAVVDEFQAGIEKVDPKKMIDTGSFRVDTHGQQKRTAIPYARSQAHLMELTDSVCNNFEDYAQAKWKSNGKPTIIRMVTPQGNMNPRFQEVEVVPDGDLNTRLKFYCENIIEEQEDDLLELFAGADNENIHDEICVHRSNLCSESAKDEL